MINAIVVTFNPDTLPDELCRILSTQCAVLIIDNSTDRKCIDAIKAWCALNKYCNISMNGNVGIAAAQNAGIEAARANGACGVVFFDQDSILDETAISVLADAIKSRDDAIYSLTPGNYSFQTEPTTIVRRELLSSGSGCQLDIFCRVGVFEAELFIDCVDYEWGWRCQQNGIEIIGLIGGVFKHSYGKRKVSTFGLSYHIDSPIRFYYQFRNITQMTFRSYVPNDWKFRQILRTSVKLFLSFFVTRKRFLRLYYAIKGVADGMRGKLGPYSYRV